MGHQTYELRAELRDRVGKGAARALRTKGLVPAIIYGDKQAPLPVSVSRKEVTLRLGAGGFLTTLATLDVDGKKHQVLPKAFELDPVRDTILHLDFLRVSADSQVVVRIPVHFINQELSPGIKRGGVLNIVRHEIEVVCRAMAIPEFIEGSLEGLEIGDSLHISAIKLPAGAKPTITGRDFTVATVAGSMAMKPEEEEKPEVEAAEVPAIAQKAPEGGEPAAPGKEAKAAPGGKEAKAAPATATKAEKK